MADDEYEEDMDELIRREEEEREQKPAPSQPPLSSSSSLPALPPPLEPVPDDYGGGFMPESSGDPQPPVEEKYPDSPRSSSPATSKRKTPPAPTSDDDLFDADALASLDADIAAQRYPPPAPTPLPSDVHSCCECHALAYSVPYFKAFHVTVCRDCQSANPALYSLITKSTARTEHLLTDADFEGLPFMLKANPTRGSFANMKLYRVRDVLAKSSARWGAEGGVEEEKRRREKERLDRDVAKRKKSRIAVEKERKVREYQHQPLQQGHVHRFLDDKKSGKQKCKECGFSLAFEEL